MKKISNVFYISIAVVLIAVIAGVITPEKFEAVTSSMTAFVTSRFGWYYLLLMTVILAISIFLIFSPYGKIRLGKDSDRPQFSTTTWIAMLFSAGMGIGLVFYGAAEPLSHYAVMTASEAPYTVAAFKEALRQSFFHWGLHVWAMYGIVALILAYFQFRKGEPALVSGTLKPIFGDKVKGPVGTIIDVLAVFATVFGVATSLGLGAMQINAGLNYLFGVSMDIKAQFLIVVVVTFLFILSAKTGLQKGIKYLSNTNLVLALALLGFVLILGPTLLIFNVFTESVGGYFTHLIEMSFQTSPFDSDKRAWVDAWTIFYWAWWIAWAPFVSMFIARISKGRTIREFMIGVLLAPTLLSMVWFSAFGTTAVQVENSGKADLASAASEIVIFKMFDTMPGGIILSVIAVLLIGSFFITSADSATFVLGMQSTNGSLLPPDSVKVTWGIIQSAIALILLFVGGLGALQNAIIIAALPFSFVILLMIISFFKAISSERRDELKETKSLRKKIKNL